MKLELYPLKDYCALLEGEGLLAAPLPGDLELERQVELVSCDSRQAVPGTLFICKGAHFKPEFLVDAARLGAFAYVSETPYPQVELPCILAKGSKRLLAVDLGDNARTNGTAAFTDSETQALFDGNRSDQFHIHFDVIARHAHLGAFRQGDDASNVSGTEIELRTIVVEERGMTAAFFFLQDVNLATEFGVRMDGAGFAQNLAALDLSSLDTTQQGSDVIASLSEVKQFSEHLNTGNNGLEFLFLQTNNLNLFGEFQNASLNSTGSNSTTTGDGEDVLDWHQEWQVFVSLWGWDVLVNCIHQLIDWSVSRVGRIIWSFQSLQSGTFDDWGIIAWEVILIEQVTDFHLYQLEQLWVVNLVARECTGTREQQEPPHWSNRWSPSQAP